MRALFPLAQVVATPGALTALAATDVSTIDYLQRHVSGDCGDLRAENGRPLNRGFGILSSDCLATDVRRWVITEADRSLTTLILPEKY